MVVVRREGALRQLVVNSVMATDIMDKGTKQTGMLAGARLLPSSRRKSRTIVINRKATIVMKRDQASDVAHTMQHWRLSLQWNLFEETYKAYLGDAQRRILLQTGTKLKLALTFTSFHWPKLKDYGVFGV
jgi:hypothetical protein